MPKVTIYTDGSCEPNPGPGGWAVILLFVKSDGTTHRRERTGYDAATTNNRMEITAVLEGLRTLTKPCNVTILTDSQYAAKGVGNWRDQAPTGSAGWMVNWRDRGWKRKEGPLLNVDLWQEMWDEVQRHTAVTMKWVRGHDGNPLNEECDRLALAARENIPS